MQQMMQMFGQMMCMPMNLFADAVSRTMNTVSRDANAWARGWNCGWEQPCGGGCDSGWKDGCKDDGCKDDGCGDSWDSRSGCGDGWGTSSGCRDGWSSGGCNQCGKDPCCCGSRHRGSDRDCLVEYSLVSVPPGGDGEVLDHGQRMVSCETPEEFNNQVIADYVQRAGRKVEAKYLRVWSRQLDCWAKPCWDWEEQQIAALRGIQHAINVKNPATASA